MNPVPVIAICVWCLDWSSSDISNIQFNSGQEFITEVTPIIEGGNSSEVFDIEQCDMVVHVKNDIERCSDLINKKHDSFCNEFQGDEEGTPRYRVFIEKVDSCILKWNADITTPESKNPKVIGKLLQLCVLTYLGLRISDYSNPLDDNKKHRFSTCDEDLIASLPKGMASDIIRTDKGVRERAKCPKQARTFYIINQVITLGIATWVLIYGPSQLYIFVMHIFVMNILVHNIDNSL